MKNCCVSYVSCVTCVSCIDTDDSITVEATCSERLLLRLCCGFAIEHLRMGTLKELLTELRKPKILVDGALT